MKTTANFDSGRFDVPGATRAASRVGLMVLVAVGFGLAGGGFWYWRQAQQPVVETVAAPAPSVVLSEPTRKILAGLNAPVELRLFIPREISVLPEALGGYVTRVESLLAEYERAAAGKLRIIKSDPQSDAAAKVAAGAAGVVPFTTEAGEVVYLGLTVGSGARIESIAPLAPEWEAALESDVSRAIRRVTAGSVTAVSVGATTPASPTPIDPAISEELLRTFPNLATQSFEEAAKVLRERALEEFKSAAAVMQAKVAVAQKALAEAQANKSEADQQAARKVFQDVQAEQTDKLKAITARLQERIEVLVRLKGPTSAPAAAKQP